MLTGLAKRWRFVAVAGVVSTLAVGILILSLATSGDSATAASGGPEMTLNVKGGDCDDLVRPTECNVALGATFTLSVDALAIPPTGYALLQTYIHFGPDLAYLPTASPAEEVTWPDCSANTTVRQQLDFTLPGSSISSEVVSHSCITTSTVEPFPLSSFVGNVLAIDLSCTPGDSSTLLRLLPFDHPIPRSLGTLLFDPNEIIVIPKVGDLLLNCGAGGPLATATPSPTLPPPPPTPTGPTTTPRPTRTPAPTALPVPKGNDNFADAIPISDPLPFSNVQLVDASAEPGEPSPCATLAQTVWFSYTPPVDVVLTADTVGSSRGLEADSALAVYTGSSITTLTNVACDDDSGPDVDAEVVISAVAGTTYYFQVGAKTRGAQNLAFNLHEPPAKGNDNFAGAVVVSTALPYSNKDDAGGATLEPGEPRPCALIDNTVWYSYTPASSGVFAVDTNGSDYDTALAVYTGATLASLVNLGCDDNAGFLRNSRIAFVAQAGVTYYFQVGGAFEARGNAVLNLSAETAPIKGNDNFANATVIGQPLPFANKEDTAGATLEPGEPRSCGGTGTVWYKLTPDSDVVIRGNTSGSSANANLAVYTGNDPDPVFRTPRL